jgi:hypothetical protein
MEVIDMAIPGSQPPTTAPVAVGVRLFYTALGAAGLIFGAFQHWTRHLDGTELPWGGLSQDTINPPDNAMRTLGAAAIALGLLAVAGLADASGMLTRIAGSLGIVGVVLFIIQVERSPYHNVEIGVWIGLAGSILCVVAGMKAERVRLPRVPGDY